MVMKGDVCTMLDRNISLGVWSCGTDLAYIRGGLSSLVSQAHAASWREERGPLGLPDFGSCGFNDCMPLCRRSLSCAWPHICRLITLSLSTFAFSIARWRIAWYSGCSFKTFVKEDF